MDPFYYLCFMFVYDIVLSVRCSLVITCWERADLLALLCVIFPCVFVTFPYGVSIQVRYLIVSIPDICLLLYFYKCYILSHEHLHVSLNISPMGKTPELGEMRYLKFCHVRK